MSGGKLPTHAYKRQLRCHSGARTKSASPESMNTGLWNMDSGPAASRHPGMTTEQTPLRLAPVGASRDCDANVSRGIPICCRPNASIIPRSPNGKPLALPGGARLAVWVIVNVEEWDINETMPRTVLTPPAGGAPMPDIPNWAWHEYGNRVGFWRMVEVFDDLRIPAVLAINGSAIARYGTIVRAASERHWEFIGHGFSQKNMQKVADERDDIRKTSAAIRDGDRQEPARLARTGPHRDLGDPRPPRRGGLRLCLRLGARRRAGGVEDARQADRQPALYAGMQRCRDDADPASQGERVSGPRGRPVRAALCRCAAFGAGDGAGRPPLHHGGAAPAQIRPQRARPHQRAIAMCCSGPASRSSIGTWRSAKRDAPVAAGGLSRWPAAPIPRPG